MKSTGFRIPKLKTCLVVLPPAMLVLLAFYLFGLSAVHRCLGLCPLTLSKFEESNVIPIVYGLPSRGMLEEAQKGHILLGGCILGSTVAVCPHCHAGVKFRDWVDELEGI